MKSGYIHPNFVAPDKPNDVVYISYSQFQGYMKCPKYWKLCYIDKLKQKTPTIHTVFGNAMHTVIQEWVEILYNGKVKDAEAFDFDTRLHGVLKEEYRTSVVKNNNVHFSSKEELLEFYMDGLSTLKYMLKKRKSLFNRKDEILIGIELPLYVIVDGVCLISFLDLVFKDKVSGKIIIKDLKTSKMGWTKWDKDDEVKVSQLILYKMYFAQQYNMDINDIDIEYVILKRKVTENAAYPIPRISVFKPASGKVKQNQVAKMFGEFISGGFVNGKYNVEREYPATTGQKDYNCRFCEFADDDLRCPKSQRVCY